jgi:hypothetical protein
MNRNAFCALILVSFLFANGKSIGQAPVQAATTALAPTPSIIESMKKMVVFLQTNCIEPDEQGKQVVKSYAGTAFLLGLEDPRLKGREFTYLERVS